MLASLLWWFKMDSTVNPEKQLSSTNFVDISLLSPAFLLKLLFGKKTPVRPIRYLTVSYWPRRMCRNSEEN